MALMNGTFNYDEKFFQEALRKDTEDSSIRVLSIDCESATNKGDNYLSDIYRVLVRYLRFSKDGKEVNETRSLIVKCELNLDGNSRKMYEENKIFIIELKVLQEILPLIRRSLGRQLGPEVLYGVKRAPRAIVMEDLSARGFIVKDKLQGLSLDHATLAIQNLAMFHAGSVSICEENPQMVKQFNKGLLNNCPEGMYRVVETGLTKLSMAVRTWSDSKCDRLSSKIEALSGRVRQQMMDVYNCEPDEFLVLNHGDCWVNNMLFRENDRGEPCEHMFVDFQMSVYTSPAMDLQYFLSMNPSLDLKCDADDILLQRYLDTLTATMKSLSCKTVPPTFEALKKAMLEKKVIAVMSSLVFYPTVTVDKKKIQSFEEMEKSGEARMDIFESPFSIQTLRKIIPVFGERGYLD